LPEHLPHSHDLSVFASLNTSWQSGQNISFIIQIYGTFGV
jgi:hypothetical protein